MRPGLAEVTQAKLARIDFASGSIATTDAPEMTAPEASVTTPEILPVMLADADADAKSTNANTRTAARGWRCIADLLLEEASPSLKLVPIFI
jgi:hypothetical protein